MDVLLHLPNRLGRKLTNLPDDNSFAAKVLQDALDEQAKIDRYQQEKIQNGIRAAKSGQFAADKDVETFFDKWQ